MRKRAERPSLSNPMLAAIVIEVVGKWKCPGFAGGLWLHGRTFRKTP
jgi:hypothetical protein